MANEHGFMITDTQLKHRFQKWDVKKYINDDDMATMLALKRKRQAIGKDIRFQYKGHDVEQERLERAYKRQKRQAASPTFIQPYIKVYISPNQSPQPASQAFVRGYNPSQCLKRQFDPEFDSQNMQASVLMDWTNGGPDPSQSVYTRSTNEPGYVEVAQTSQIGFMIDTAQEPVDNCFDTEAVEGGFKALSTEATSGLSLNQAFDDINMKRPSRNGSISSSGAWQSLMNWSPNTATSILAIDERASDGLSLLRNTVPSQNTDIMPLLGPVESEGGPLSKISHAQPENDQPVTCANFDPSSALLPLLLMKAHLEQDFCSHPHSEFVSRFPDLGKLLDIIHGEWLGLELDNVVCWISETVSRNIRQHQARRRTNRLASPFEERREAPPSRGRSGDDIGTDDEVRLIGKSCAESESHKGVLRVILGNIITRGSSANTVGALSVSFMPKEPRRTTGLRATFVNKMSEISDHRISPRLTTFNVVPGDSEIINCVKRNDVKGLQTLFDKREASPRDVDPGGFSLLSYAMFYGDCEIFRLLLEGGADVQTCNSSTNTLDMVWAVWLEFVEACVGWRYPDLPNSIIRSIDQCMRMSDAALRYGCDIDNSFPFNSQWPNPLFFLVDEVEVPPQELENALRYLCKIGYDIEERNSGGATLFLFEATLLCPSVVSILRFLVEHGAYLHTVDTSGRGALHLVFEAPHSWGAWDSSCTDYCDHSGIDHEYWASFRCGTESENYARDYCEDGLTPAPSVIDDIQHDHLTCDDWVQERPYFGSGGICLSTTGLIKPGSHSARKRSEQYIDLEEAKDVSEDYVEFVEDDDEKEDIGEYNEDDEDGGEDEDDEALEIPEGYVLCNDGDGNPLIIRKPLLILKTRLRFKLLTLLRAGCDPNIRDYHGNSPGDNADYYGLWPEWTWALLNAGYVFDENSDRWVKKVEDEVPSVS